MHNQHLGLSQLLASQRSSEHHDQAAQARLVSGARPPRGRRRRAEVAHRWWQLARWPAIATIQRQPPAKQQLIDRRKTMSKHTRALILTAIVVAMNLAGMTAIAQAQPPDAVEQFRRGERASQQPTTAEAVEEFRRTERASQQQPTSADTQRPPTEAQVGESWRHPGNLGVRPPEPSGQPDWLIPAIAVLAAILALVAGLAVLATKRPDGTGLRRLTAYGPNRPRATQPRSTSDDTVILYYTHHPDRRPRQIYAINADGSGDAPVLTAKPISTHPILQP